MKFKTTVIGSKEDIDTLIEKYNSEIKLVFEISDAKRVDEFLRTKTRPRTIREIIRGLKLTEIPGSWTVAFSKFYNENKGDSIVRLKEKYDKHHHYYKDSINCAKAQKLHERECYISWCDTMDCLKRKTI